MTSFGVRIREARKRKGYSQNKLAELVKVDKTYICAIENDRASYIPKEKVVRALAHHLELDEPELVCLAGRVTEEQVKLIQSLMQVHSKMMLELIRKMSDRPDLVQKLLTLQEQL